jgi:hypothetical protein
LPSNELVPLDAVSRAQASWAALEPRLSEHALAFTHALVARAPDVLELVHGKTGAALTDPSMQAVMLAHQRTLLTLPSSCVAGQRDLAALAPTLVATGRMHARFGDTIRDFLAPCGAALADTLAAALGEAFTADVEAAWARVFAFVAAHMHAAGDRCRKRRWRRRARAERRPAWRARGEQRRGGRLAALGEGSASMMRAHTHHLGTLFIRFSYTFASYATRNTAALQLAAWRRSSLVGVHRAVSASSCRLPAAGHALQEDEARCSRRRA